MYLLTNTAWPGYVKIGSAVSLSARIQQYQTCSPFRDYQLFAAAFFPDRLTAERRLLRSVRGHRMGRAEWVHAHPHDVKHILERLQKQETE